MDIRYYATSDQELCSEILEECTPFRDMEGALSVATEYEHYILKVTVEKFDVRFTKEVVSDGSAQS